MTVISYRLRTSYAQESDHFSRFCISNDAASCCVTSMEKKFSTLISPKTVFLFVSRQQRKSSKKIPHNITFSFPKTSNLENINSFAAKRVFYRKWNGILHEAIWTVKKVCNSVSVAYSTWSCELRKNRCEFRKWEREKWRKKMVNSKGDNIKMTIILHAAATTDAILTHQHTLKMVLMVSGRVTLLFRSHAYSI